MVVHVIVVALVFCPLGNPEPFSISGWSPAARPAALSAPPPTPPPPVSSDPTTGASQGLRVGSAGVLGVSGSPATLFLLLRVTMLLRPWRLPEQVMPMSPKAHFPGPAEGFSVFTGHGGMREEGTVFAQQLPFLGYDVFSGRAKMVKVHFALT